MHLVENDLLQEVQPDIVGRRAFTQPRIMVLATEKLDIVVVLIEMEVQIAAAVSTDQKAGEHIMLAFVGTALADFPPLLLHLFKDGSFNDRLVERP